VKNDNGKSKGKQPSSGKDSGEEICFAVYKDKHHANGRTRTEASFSVDPVDVLLTGSRAWVVVEDVNKTISPWVEHNVPGRLWT